MDLYFEATLSEALGRGEVTTEELKELTERDEFYFELTFLWFLGSLTLILLIVILTLGGWIARKIEPEVDPART